MARIETVLVTGADGMIAPDLAGFLSGKYRVRMSDRVEVETEYEFVAADLGEYEAVRRACEGIDAVVHLGAQSWEADFDSVMVPANIQGARNLFEAARREKVQRVIFATTNHTVGMYFVDDTLEVTEEAPVRPDTVYAATKLFGEAFARMYWERWGLSAACLRIGSYMNRARIESGLSRPKEAMLLSPRDFAQMVTLCLEKDGLGFEIFNCISNARRPWLSIEKARRVLGYAPEDSVVTIFGAEARAEPLSEPDWAWLFDEEEDGKEM